MRQWRRSHQEGSQKMDHLKMPSFVKKSRDSNIFQSTELYILYLYIVVKNIHRVLFVISSIGKSGCFDQVFNQPFETLCVGGLRPSVN